MNKTQKIREHLVKHGNITTWDGISLYGETRLSDVIFRLRQKGWDIRTIMCDFEDKYGNAGQYAKYVYKGMINEK